MLQIFNAPASTRLAVIGMLVAGLSMYVRYHVSTMPRPNFNGLEYIEDSRNGTGVRYRVITRGAPSGASKAEVEVLFRPTAVGFFPNYPGSTPYHSHTRQEEALHVVEGTLGYTVEGTTKQAAAGETIIVPAGVKHSCWCAGEAPVLVRVTLTPAGPMGEVFFENLAGLGFTYGDVSKVHPLQLVVLFQEAGVKIEGVPEFISWALSNVLAPFARWLGFQPTYPQYRSAGPSSAAEDEGVISSYN